MGDSFILYGVAGAIVLLVGGVAFLLWRRAEAKRWVAARDIRPSQVPPERRSTAPAAPASSRPSDPPAPPPKGPRLPPHRIVFATDEVPVIEVVRARGEGGLAEGVVVAPALAGKLSPVAREAAGLMPLPGSDRCRILVRAEVARAMHAGILPLLLAKSPVAPVTGEGVETLRADPALLAELGQLAWQTAGAERLRRFLVGLDGRLAVLGGGAMQDAVAAIRARRTDLLELLADVLAGTVVRDRAKSRLAQVEDSCRARTDDLFRQLASLPGGAQDAAVALRQVCGSLLLTTALRAAAVEVRALTSDQADLALPKLVELEALLGRVAGAIGARRRAEVEDSVLDLLTLAEEMQTAIHAARDRLFAREVELYAEVADDGSLGRILVA